MSKCPFHNASTTSSDIAPSSAVAGGGAEEEMCSYARKKRQAEAEAAAHAATDAQRCPHLAAAGQKKEQESAAAGAEGKCPYLAAKNSSSAKTDVAAGGGAPAATSALADPTDQADWSKATADDFKRHFTHAYNEAALTSATSAALNDKIASVLVGALGYSQAELDTIGADVSLMQGTGNPHILAAIQSGEFVIDLGSGFGLDAILAGSKVGATGRVVGIDLSINELTNAIRRVSARRLRNIDFRLADIEALPFEDASVDCAISNGGFCLVPNKAVAFGEIFRVLKPGGRFSVSCTVRLQELDPTKDWPSCMVVFMPLNTTQEMLSRLGFVDIVIDDSSSRDGDAWDKGGTGSKAIGHSKPPPSQTPPVVPEGAEGEQAVKESKVTIHKNDSRYHFLKEMNMAEWFARVNIYGRKPL